MTLCPGEEGFECVSGIKAKGLCRRCYNRKWMRRVPDKVAEWGRRYREANPEKRAELWHDWYEANRTRRRDYQRSYYPSWADANRDKVNSYSRRYYANNRQKHAQAVRRWQEANRDVVLAKNRAATQRRRARKAANLVVPFTVEELDQRMAYWGNQCWIRGPLCRGDGDTVDHVIPIVLGGPHCLSNLRPACRSCNASKGAVSPSAYLERTA